MRDPNTPLIRSVAEFLAHALELEMEAVDRYRELADSMELHNNPEVAELFRGQAELGIRHTETILTRAQGLRLPPISPWDFKWDGPGPEVLGMDRVNYLMDAHQALTLALHNETRGRDFYAQVAASSPDPAVRAIAHDLAAEEDAHARTLAGWLAALGPVPDLLEDLDPPNRPD